MGLFSGIVDTFSSAFDPVTEFVNDEIFSDVFGIDDPSLAGQVGGGLLGFALGGALGQSAVPVGGLSTPNVGALLGQSSGERVQGLREKLEADNKAEALRKQFNDDIFNLALNLSGNLAKAGPGGNLALGSTPGGPQTSSLNIHELIPFGDEDQLLKFSGDDPRGKQLEKLASGLASRSRDIITQRTAPGTRQTRLSLVG